MDQEATHRIAEHLTGRILGRPSQDPAQRSKQLELSHADQKRRNIAERSFGAGKRKYSFDKFMAKRKEILSS